MYCIRIQLILSPWTLQATLPTGCAFRILLFHFTLFRLWTGTFTLNNAKIYFESAQTHNGVISITQKKPHTSCFTRAHLNFVDYEQDWVQTLELRQQFSSRPRITPYSERFPFWKLRFVKDEKRHELACNVNFSCKLPRIILLASLFH